MSYEFENPFQKSWLSLTDITVSDDLALRNIFKEEWEDSDTIFIIEESKFHVHRALLSLMSPVFKVMFNSDFREKDEQEIPLPEKKAKSFLSFLLIIYSREDDHEVTMRNISDLVKLGDEYQVTKVTKECRKFLMSISFSDKMAVDFLLLARRFRLTDVENKCYYQLRSVHISRLKQLAGFHELDKDSIKEVLVPQLEKANQHCTDLMELLKEVLPQLLGSIDLIIHLIVTKKSNSYELTLCPIHYDKYDGKPKGAFMDLLQTCTACQDMFRAVPNIGSYFDHWSNGREVWNYRYGYKAHLDENVIGLLRKLTKE